MLKRVVIFAALCLVLVILPTAGNAQGGNTCPVLVEQALAAMENNCAGLGRNIACYGFNSVGATFTEEVSEDFFINPSDSAGIATIQTIRTTPLDLDLGTWGIAVMNIQANLPNTMPGQGVVFILMGETEVANGVENPFIPVDPVSVTVNSNANIRSGPGATHNVISTTSPGATLDADGWNEAHDWLRVSSDRFSGWIFADLVNLVDEVEPLPVIGEETLTPMQAFYFTTSIGQPTCQEAPDILLIQGPQNVVVNLTANEANIQIGSTIALKQISDTLIEIMVIKGWAIVNNLYVPQGFKAVAPIGSSSSEDVQIIPSGLPIVTGPWEGCMPFEEQEFILSNLFAQIPPELLNYPITVPGETSAICDTPEEFQQWSADQIGQYITQICSNFAITGPTGSIPHDATALLTWTAVPGARGYQVNLYNADNTLLGSFTTPNNELSFDLAEMTGLQFSWTVDALNSNGDTLCSAGPASLLRDLPPPPPPPPPPPQETKTPTPTPVETPEVTPYCVPFCSESACPPSYYEIVEPSSEDCPGGELYYCMCEEPVW